MLFTVLLSTLDAYQQNFIIELYEKYKKLIYSIAYDYFEDAHYADDTVSIVIEKVINHIEIFENCPESKLISLIATYTKNTVIDMYRKNRTIHNHEIHINTTVDKPDLEIVDNDFNIDEIIITNVMIDIVKKSMLKLDSVDREIIKMRLIQNQSAKTVAELLDITVNAVNLRLMHAKQRLTLLLKESMGDE